MFNLSEYFSRHREKLSVHPTGVQVLNVVIRRLYVASSNYKTLTDCKINPIFVIASERSLAVIAIPPLAGEAISKTARDKLLNRKYLKEIATSAPNRRFLAMTVLWVS